MTPFFAGPAAPRCSKACLCKVSRKYSKDSVGPISSQMSRLKSNILLKQTSFDAKPCTSPYENPSVRELDPDILQTCLMCPCRALYEHVGKKIAENVGSVVTQISPQKILFWRGKKKNSRQQLGRGTWIQFSKTRRHWHPKEFGVLCLNQREEK